jgi:mannan endo-1,6-alpha-mannosidase
MYNYTNADPKWKQRIDGFLKNTQRVFFPDQYGSKTMVEYACETQSNCNKDQRSFKAYLSRWLAVTAQIVPYSAGQITPWLQTSAMAASKACTKTSQGLACGRIWYENRDDGQRDVGNQMTALSIVQSNLIGKARSLVDIKTGDSASNPGAGAGGKTFVPDPIYTRKMTIADKVGAWLVTVIALALFFIGAFAVLFEEDEIKDYAGFLGTNRQRTSWAT